MEQIERLEKVPLSDKDLVRMLGPDAKRVRVMMYEDLKNYKSLHELLPNEYDAVIVLLQIQSPGASPVGHWITLMNHGTHFEHFDSYGLDPDEELSITHEHSHLTDIIKNTQARVETSQYKLQAKKEAVNTCGRWAVVRSKNYKLEKKEFVNFIRTVHSVPDVAVTLLTYHL
jgi:hypothetical protein